MINADKLSPMTIYYLRKVVNSNKIKFDRESSLSHEVQAQNNIWEEKIQEGIQRLSNPSKMEKLITIHKNLKSSSFEKTHQIQYIEDQIYKLLGISTNEGPFETISNIEDLIPFEGKKYGLMMNQLYQSIRKANSLIDARVTSRYLHKTRPEKYKRIKKSNSENDNKLRDVETAAQLELYEEWTELFCNYLEQNIPHIFSSSTQITKVTQRIHLARQNRWHNLKHIVGLVSQVSNNPDLIRGRDLVKLLNLVYIQSVEVFGAIRTRSYLLESRPEDRWCHMFSISKSRTVIYGGNIREIIPISRLKSFEIWMQNFWQVCEAKQAVTDELRS